MICDLWQDRAGRHRLGVSIIFITPNWEMHSICLGVRLFERDHSAESIKKTVAALLDEYLVKAPLCYVADNCSAAVAANTKLVDMTDRVISGLLEVPEELSVDVEEDEQLPPDQEALFLLQNALQLPTDSIGCHCHSLELAVGDALRVKTVESIIKDLKDFIGAYKTSSRTRAVVQAALRPGETMPFLPQDVATRWTSTFRMVDAFVRNIEIFTRASEAMQSDTVLANIPGAQNLDSLTSSKERRLLSKLKELLAPLANAVDKLQGDSYPTLSWVQILATSLLQKIRAKKVEETQALKRSDTFLEVLKKLEKSLQARLIGENLPEDDMPIDDIAPALDPRTKGWLFLQRAADREAVRKHIEDLASKTRLSDEVDESKRSTANDEPEPLEQKLLDCGVGKEQNKRTTAQEEVLMFRQEPSSAMDPLQWWLLKELKYPRLAFLARNYLAVPAMTKPKKRVFFVFAANGVND